MYLISGPTIPPACNYMYLIYDTRLFVLSFVTLLLSSNYMYLIYDTRHAYLYSHL